MDDPNCNELSLLQSAELTGSTPFCPEDQAIAEYYAGVLAQAKRPGLERHLANCQYCRTRIGMLERLEACQSGTRFAPDVSRGCDPANDDIQTALSFVLDENTTDNRERASGLHVWDLTIDTHDGVDNYNDPLCTAIEVVRKPGFTDPDATGNGNKDGQVFVTNVAIADGSYERIGIRYEGFQPLGSINHPIVNGNIIGEQYCGDEADTARAIQFGRVQLSDPSDPSSQVTGVVDSNTIRMATGCETSGGVGILVVGEPPSPDVPYYTTAEVVKNDVSGAFVGVLVDDDVADVKFSGNTMTGDGAPDTGDIGICSDALSTATKGGKPNIITYFDDEIIEGGCWP